MTPLRTIRAIEDDILALKETFDARYLENEYCDRYSRMSLQRQWVALNKSIEPLVAELKATIQYNIRQEEIAAYARIEAMKKKRIA